MPDDVMRGKLGRPGGEEAGDSMDALLPKRRIVVTIGINAYQTLPKLRRAVSDAEGVRRLLTDQFGFVVLAPPLLDAEATKAAIEALIYDKLRELLQPDDALVLFFAGHGTSRVDIIGNKKVEHGYLVPVAAAGGNSYSDLIDIEHFLSQVGSLPAKHILVVLDACDSGMALGTSVKQYRDKPSFARDLARPLSRRVITSAQRNQPALDGGPIAEHSLFTGTLIDGLRWGKAAYGNDFVTSSSLGLYLQQQVGLASESQQTPDFGSFHLDDRGELLLPIGEGSFDNLRASAYSALQRGERSRFAELTRKAVALRPKAPETLYLQFRASLIDEEIQTAAQLASSLSWMQLDKGRIPLSAHDLETHAIILRYWAEVLRIHPAEIPLQIEVLAGLTRESLIARSPQRAGDLEAYCVALGETIAFRVTNPTGQPGFLYLIAYDEAGRIRIDRLWRDPEIMFRGLEPGATRESMPYRIVGGDEGITEMHMFYSPQIFNDLLSPPAVGSRAALPAITPTDATDLLRRTLYFLITAPKDPAG